MDHAPKTLEDLKFVLMTINSIRLMSITVESRANDIQERYRTLDMHNIMVIWYKIEFSHCNCFFANIRMNERTFYERLLSSETNFAKLFDFSSQCFHFLRQNAVFIKQDPHPLLFFLLPPSLNFSWSKLSTPNKN